MSRTKLLVVRLFWLGVLGVNLVDLLAAAATEVVPEAGIDFRLANETRQRWSDTLMRAVTVDGEIDLAAIRTALRNHADPSQYGAEAPPLMRLARNHDPSAQAAMSLLLANGADVDVKSAEGRTPLMEAVYANNLAAVKLLLAARADINATSATGEAHALTWSLTRLPILQTLFEADPHFCQRPVNTEGDNLLMNSIDTYVIACSIAPDNLRTATLDKLMAGIDWLLANCSNVNEQDRTGKTALLLLFRHLLIMFKDLREPAGSVAGADAEKIVLPLLPLLRSLIKAGADPKIANQNGLNAFDYIQDLSKLAPAALCQRLQLILTKEEGLLSPVWQKFPVMQKRLAAGLAKIKAGQVAGAAASAVVAGSAVDTTVLTDSEIAELEAEIARREAALAAAGGESRAAAATARLAELEAELARLEAEIVRHEAASAAAAGVSESKAA